MSKDSENYLQKVYEQLLQVICLEDVFGDIDYRDGSGRRQLNAIYLNIMKIMHPDFHSDPMQKEIAKKVCKILEALNIQAGKRLDEGDYGLRIPRDDLMTVDGGLNIRTPQGDYVLQFPLATGDLAALYRGQIAGVAGAEGQIVIKIIADPADNDLALNEIKVLKILQAEESPQSKHLPVLLDNFKTTENQHGLILRYFAGHDLYAVREKYAGGLDPRHVAWILTRTLSALGYAHSLGIVHGNIEPAHILLRPRDHNIYLIDWSYACVNPMATGDSFKVFNELYSPPEVAEKKSPLSSSDIYSLGKTMIYLLGGDPKTNSIPDQVPELLQCFLHALILESPLQRPRDAWDLHREFSEVRTKIWGPPKFLELPMNIF
jgi:serine/threonine protein kinase